MQPVVLGFYLQKYTIASRDQILQGKHVTENTLPQPHSSTQHETKVRLHGSPRLINVVESMKLYSTVERYFLHVSTKVNEAVDSKMAANELVREGVVVICDYLIK